MEGATPGSAFWKITFPMVSPLLLVNVVYTIVDSFTAADNALTRANPRCGLDGVGFWGEHRHVLDLLRCRFGHLGRDHYPAGKEGAL